jgi:hypothetical protein
VTCSTAVSLCNDLPTTTNSSHHRDILDASLFFFSNAAGLKNINPRLFLKKEEKEEFVINKR